MCSECKNRGIILPHEIGDKYETVEFNNDGSKKITIREVFAHGEHSSPLDDRPPRWIEFSRPARQRA
jgi:hypothetical protein